MKITIDGLVAEHSIFHSRGQLGFSDYSNAERAARPTVAHPLVRIDGRPVPEGRLLLRDLLEHATQREFVFRHHWRTRDLVIWDNRRTPHRLRPYEDATHARDLRRVTTKDVDVLAAPEADPSARVVHP